MSICLVPTLRMRQMKTPRFFLCLQLVIRDYLTAVEDGSLFQHGRRSGEGDPSADQRRVGGGTEKGKGDWRHQGNRGHKLLNSSQ